MLEFSSLQKEMKKKGFTLIEIIIVLVIVGILMGIGMSLNRGSIEKLRSKSSIEEISSFFDTTFLQIQASNYQNGKAYSGIELTLEENAREIRYKYYLIMKEGEEGNDEYTGSYAGDFFIENITGDSSSIGRAIIEYLPFSPNCKITQEGSETNIEKLYFSAKPKGLKKACFELDSNYCKLRNISCFEDGY